MKIYRLFGILTLLLNKKTITAKELANRFEVSTRTIYRDIDVLSEAGIPIYANKGYQGGISLMDHYTLDKTMLTKEESEGIYLTLKTLQVTQYPEINVIMEKFSGLIDNLESFDWVDVDFSSWGSQADEVDKFNAVKRAILSECQLSFMYSGSNGKTVERTIAPLKMIYKSQAWYIWGYCYLREDYRLFKTHRMRNVRVLELDFNRVSYDTSFDTKEVVAMDQYAGEITLSLRFSNAMKFMVFDHFQPDDYVIEEDGSYLVTVTFPKSDWILSYVMSFGESVEIVGPASLKRDYIALLKRTLDKY